MVGRLKIFYATLGITLQEFEKQCRLNNGQAGKLLSGKMGVTYDKLSGVFIAYPQLNANWLISGKGQMLNSEANAPFRLNPDENPARILADTLTSLHLPQPVHDKCMACLDALELAHDKTQKELLQQHQDYVTLTKALIQANAAIIDKNK